MKQITLDLMAVAAAAGFMPGADWRLNLPAGTPEIAQATADALAAGVLKVLGPWRPGDEAIEVVQTGAGPVWAHLVMLHAVAGRASKVTYSAPNAEVVIYRHGI